MSTDATQKKASTILGDSVSTIESEYRLLQQLRFLRHHVTACDVAAAEALAEWIAQQSIKPSVRGLLGMELVRLSQLPTLAHKGMASLLSQHIGRYLVVGTSTEVLA